MLYYNCINMLLNNGILFFQDMNNIENNVEKNSEAIYLGIYYHLLLIISIVCLKIPIKI